MGKEDIKLMTKPMKMAFSKIVDHDETFSGVNVGEGVVTSTTE